MTASPVDLGYVAPPTPADLARYLGWPGFDVEQEVAAQDHLDRAVSLAKAYTRGRGWVEMWMAPALAGVILSFAGRSMNNPTGDSRVEAGTYKSSPGQPEFSLTERLILDGHRHRAASFRPGLTPHITEMDGAGLQPWPGRSKSSEAPRCPVGGLVTRPGPLGCRCE